MHHNTNNVLVFLHILTLLVCMSCFVSRVPCRPPPPPSSGGGGGGVVIWPCSPGDVGDRSLPPNIFLGGGGGGYGISGISQEGFWYFSACMGFIFSYHASFSDQSS